jgi:hypothetical protein
MVDEYDSRLGQGKWVLKRKADLIRSSSELASNGNAIRKRILDAISLMYKTLPYVR